MKYPWLHVGAKVVCVRNDTKRDLTGGEKVPEVGKTYTVREIVTFDYLCIRLCEIVNPVKDYTLGIMEGAYTIEAFRPVLPCTDHIIEQLKASLPKRGRVDA